MKFLVLISFVFISGCCSLCPEKVKEVYIKTGCLPPPAVAVPSLKVDSLTSNSTTKETVEAYVFDHMALMEYATQLQIALDPYRTCKGTP